MSIQLNFGAIPEELRKKDKWCVASLNYEGRKIPLDATNILLRNRPASINRPVTWSSFKNALQYLTVYWQDNTPPNLRVIGLEYALTADDGLIFVDFDCHTNGLEESQRKGLELKYQTMVQVGAQYRTYGEQSISGHGLHFLARGQLDANIKTGQAREMPIEIYDKDRFIIFTGARINDYGISDDEFTLNRIRSMHRCYFEPKDSKQSEWAQKPSVPIRDTPLLLDNEVLGVALKDPKFSLLWNDRWEEATKNDGSHYSSQHYADKALMNKLAFYTGNCPTQMERLFRQSPTYQAYGKNGKWAKYESDIKKDLESACQTCKYAYTPKKTD